MRFKVLPLLILIEQTRGKKDGKEGEKVKEREGKKQRRRATMNGN